MKHSCILFTQEDENGKAVHRSSFIIHRYFRMKQIQFVILLISSSLLYSCGQGKPVQEQQMDMFH
jgi:hypothetical protein